MANVFGILAAFVLAAAAFFGFTNKKALAEQKNILESEQSNLDQNEETYAERIEEEEKLETAFIAVNKENEELTVKLEAQLATNKALDADLTDKKAAVESKKPQVEEGKAKLAQFGNLEDLQRNLKDLGASLATLESELLQKNAEISSRESVASALGIENENLDAVLANYTKKTSSPDLKASVTRVINSLGFVILSGGDNAGIIHDSTLAVERNGQVIGQLKVTATESSTASASIIPDSFGDGVNVRVGDTVIAAAN